MWNVENDIIIKENVEQASEIKKLDPARAEEIKQLIAEIDHHKVPIDHDTNDEKGKIPSAQHGELDKLIALIENK
jgi:hypothetical protein